MAIVIQQTIVKYWTIQSTGYKVLNNDKIQIHVRAYGTQEEAVKNEGKIVDNKFMTVNIIGNEKINPNHYSGQIAEAIGGVEM